MPVKFTYSIALFFSVGSAVPYLSGQTPEKMNPDMYEVSSGKAKTDTNKTHHFDHTPANTILKQDAGKHFNSETLVSYCNQLADPKRKIGSKHGAEIAADFLEDWYQKNGLLPLNPEGYSFHVPLYQETWKSLSLNVGGVEAKPYEDFFAIHSICPAVNNVVSDKSFVFLGYGIDDIKYSDYKNVSNSLKGKIIVIMDGEPLDPNHKSYITHSSELSEWTTNWKHKMDVASRHEVKAVIIIQNELSAKPELYKKYWQADYFTHSLQAAGYQAIPPFVYVSFDFARTLMGKEFDEWQESIKKIETKGNPVRFNHKVQVSLDLRKDKLTLMRENVCGMLKGTKYPDQYVFMIANYDDTGPYSTPFQSFAEPVDQSGTSVMMESIRKLGTMYKEGLKPERTIVFLAVFSNYGNPIGADYFFEKNFKDHHRILGALEVGTAGMRGNITGSEFGVVQATVNEPSEQPVKTFLNEINRTATPVKLKWVTDNNFNSWNKINTSDIGALAKRKINSVLLDGKYINPNMSIKSVPLPNSSLASDVARLSFSYIWELANRIAPFGLIPKD